MSEMNIDVQSVLDDLSEQIKNMTIENAVLRAAVKQLQAESALPVESPTE